MDEFLKQLAQQMDLQGQQLDSQGQQLAQLLGAISRVHQDNVLLADQLRTLQSTVQEQGQQLVAMNSRLDAFDTKLQGISEQLAKDLALVECNVHKSAIDIAALKLAK